MKKPMEQKSVAIDFDAVVSQYEGFKGKGVFGLPVKGAKESLDWLQQAGYRVIINTTRSETWMVDEYLKLHDIPFNYINFNPENLRQHLSPAKVLADVYVDDRGLRFDGDWSQTLIEIVKFKPWWKKDETETTTE